MHLNQPQKNRSGRKSRESISVIALAIFRRWRIKKSNKLQLWKLFFPFPSRKLSAASFLIYFFRIRLSFPVISARKNNFWPKNYHQLWNFRCKKRAVLFLFVVFPSFFNRNFSCLNSHVETKFAKIATGRKNVFLSWPGLVDKFWGYFRLFVIRSFSIFVLKCCNMTVSIHMVFNNYFPSKLFKTL